MAMWAVTSLFNPMNVPTRAVNYRQFREKIGVPLLTVELSFTGQFELRDEDADILVKVTPGGVMWQKERLLNIGIARLPTECTMVAVVDSDALFANANWVDAAKTALQTRQMVQLFTNSYYLPPGGLQVGEGRALVKGHQQSAARAMRQGLSPDAVLGLKGATTGGRYTGGLAWAFRRELLAKHGLYDGCIIGGGDTAIALAAVGEFEAAERRHFMSVAQRRRYRAWGLPWFEAIRGDIDAVDGDLFHLWHGARKNRHFNSRHEHLARARFNPETDLRGESGGAWQWASDKPHLHRLLVDYFAARKEHETDERVSA